MTTETDHDLNGADVEVVSHVGADKSPMTPALEVAWDRWRAERDHIEALRLTYFPSVEPFVPAEPNSTPRSRPSWVLRAFKLADEAAAAKPPIVSAADMEAEVDQRMRAEDAKRRATLRQEVVGRVSREEFERKMRRVNAPHPSEFPPTPEARAAELREMDARREAHFEKLDARRAEINAANEAAEQARRRQMQRR
jgi:hypothetical protein